MNWGLPSQGWTDEDRESQFFGCYEGLQVMSLPRRLTLTDQNELRITPAGDIESLRGEHAQIVNRTISANRDIVLSEVFGNAFELSLEIDTNGAPMVALDVLRSPDRQEYTRIAFYRNRGLKPVLPGVVSGTPQDGAGTHSLITIDNSCSSILPEARSRPPEMAPVLLEPDEPLKMRVFVDRSIVEVFVNDKQCVALRVYPGREDSTGVSLLAQGREARVVSMDAWQLKSIYYIGIRLKDASAVIGSNLSCRSHDPLFTDVYKRQKDRGKHHLVALTHVFTACLYSPENRTETIKFQDSGHHGQGLTG